MHIKGLLTECEVRRVKYFPEILVLTELQRSEVCGKKTEVNNDYYLYGFWFIFFSAFSAVFVFRCCRLPYL